MGVHNCATWWIWCIGLCSYDVALVAVAVASCCSHHCYHYRLICCVQVLRPACHIQSLHFWDAVYLSETAPSVASGVSSEQFEAAGSDVSSSSAVTSPDQQVCLLLFCCSSDNAFISCNYCLIIVIVIILIIHSLILIAVATIILYI